MTKACPPGWSLTPLATVARNERPRVKPADHPTLPYVGMDAVEPHTMRLLGTVSATTMKSASVHFFPGDVLYGRLRPYLNKVLRAEWEGLASAEFIPLTMPNGVEPAFIQYRLNAADFVSYASHLDEGDRPRVDYGQVGSFEICLPPSPEQSRIVSAIDSYFSRLDDAVANLERVQRSLERYRASVLKAAVEGRLVPTEAQLAREEGRDFESGSDLLERILAERRRRWEDSELSRTTAKGKASTGIRRKVTYREARRPRVDDLPQLPTGWVWATVDQLIDTLDQGWSPKCERQPVATSHEWGVIKTTAIQHMAYNEGGNKALPCNLQPKPQLEVRPGDLLVTRAGPRSRVGVCCLVRRVDRRLMLCDKVYRLRVSGVGVLPGWLEVALNSPRMLDAIERLKSGISDSGLNLTQSRFRGLAVPLPPRAEQERIEAAVARSYSVAEVVSADGRRACGRVGQIRKAILKWAFQGKLADQDPGDEPAAALLERIAERGTEGPVGRRVRRVEAVMR